MKNKLVLVLIFLLALCLFGVSCNDETNEDNKDNKDDISDNSENKNDDTNKEDNVEELDSIIISIYDEINFYLIDKEDSSKRTEITEKVDLENYLNKVSKSKAVFYLVKENNELAKEELNSIDLIKAYINYYFNIYVVSSKTSEMSEGNLIIVNGQCAIVGLNAFNTMANVLIYVNALPKSSSPVIYLDSGEYNEVFNLYHDNLTIYGICAGLTLEERSEKEESIFSGSVSIKGNNIKIKGLAVADLENTFTVTGNDFIKEDIVLNVK